MDLKHKFLILPLRKMLKDDAVPTSNERADQVESKRFASEKEKVEYM